MCIRDSFNAKFREYFSTLTGISPFKFTADMATAWRKVKSEKNIKFTIEDLLKVYYGKSDYAKYDNSVCQWNQFLKDFCADEYSRNSVSYTHLSASNQAQNYELGGLIRGII